MVVGDAKGCVHTVPVDKEGIREIRRSDKQSVEHASKAKGNCWVQDLKINKTGDNVAWGVHGGLSNIELAHIEQSHPFNLTKTQSINIGLSSSLLHLDWSVCNRYLQVNSQSYELLFVDLHSKAQISASEVKDTQWQTVTCKFGFGVQGIWPGVGFNEVNSVVRSHDNKYLATTEDSGLVKLFKYPCTKEHAQF